MYLFIRCINYDSDNKHNIMNFQLNNITQETMIKVKKNMNLKILNSEYNLSGVKKFDVNNEGLVALSSEKFSTTKIINIYNNKGEYQYGYTFYLDGDYYIKWENSYLGILSVRSDVILFVDSNGNFIKYGEVKNNYYNREVFKELDKPYRFINGMTYNFKKNIGILGLLTNDYSQVEIVNEKGNEYLIYDIKQELFINVIISILTPLIIFIVVIYGTVKYFIHKKKQ